MLCCDAKHMKYLLADEGFFSLNFGGSSFDQSLFTDTELNTSEPDLSLRTQGGERVEFYNPLLLILFTTQLNYNTQL